MKIGLMLLISLVLVVPVITGQKLSADEVVAKHLASLGSPEKLASLKSMIAVGEVKIDYITQKNVPAAGRIVIASDSDKLFYGMQLDSVNYAQEMIIFDGSRIDVAMVRAGGRSLLGDFVQSNSYLVSNGLLAGPLKASWGLLTASERGLKISSAGAKKIDGKEAYALSVATKGGGDVEIKMYFDQQTFQHLRTEYSRRSSAAMGRTMDESARQNETRVKVTEDFSDYQTFEGVSLPRKYRVHYSSAGQATVEMAWVCNLSEFTFNRVDPSTFNIRTR